MSLSLSSADEAMVLAVPLFEGIDKASVMALIDGAARTSHPDGGLLFSKGDPADWFFVVLAGRVSLFALFKTGDHSLIEAIETGHSFAEGAIFASRQDLAGWDHPIQPGDEVAFFPPVTGG